MTDGQTKQAILGFTEFFKGITGNQDLKIPSEIAEKCGIQAQTDGKYITQSAGDEIRQKNYDLISRQVVLDLMQMKMGGKELYMAVYDLPPVKSQEPIGHWIVHEHAEEFYGRVVDNYECDNCGDWYLNKTNFCPNCGARMETEKNGQIDKQTLWNKAGTSNHITRADVNVRPPKDNSGTQALNEGYLCTEKR